MATFTDDIYTFLCTITDLTDIIGTDAIHWADAPTDAVNRITYRILSNPRKYHADNDDQWMRVRFWIKHNNKITCRSIADVLIENLNYYRGTVGTSKVSYISLITDEDPIKLDELEDYEIIQDYRINKH